jgi:hypothetical protein
VKVIRLVKVGWKILVLGVLALLIETAAANPAQLYATVQKSPPQITLNWINPGGITGYTVYRTTTIGGNADGTGNWGSPIINLPGTATSFADTNVALNIGYEYRVTAGGVTNGDGYIFSGIELPLIESRGKLILMVDDSFTSDLVFELNQLQRDLAGDGWIVLRHDVSRNDTPANIKMAIKSDYLADPTNNFAVFLLGHIPIAYSGWIDPDDHGPRPAPTDTFYGDMSGTWTDNINYGNNTTNNHPWWINVPGDGKYDQSTIPGRMDLEVGRVDFFNMTAFQPYGLYEVDLLRRYLNRDHDFRNGNFTVANRGADMNSGQQDYCQKQFFGPSNPTRVSDYFGTFTNNSYLWLTKGGGGGAYDYSADIGYTSYLAASNGTKVVFNSWFASSYWEWDVENGFLCAPLAAAGYNLVNFWSENPCFVLHHMALGQNIGYSTRLSQNNTTFYAHHRYLDFNLYRRGVHMSLMGDPSLRMHVVAPPANLVTSLSNGQMVLNWTASPTAGLLGYNVYRAGSSSGPFTRLNNAYVTGTTFTDTNPPVGARSYMVRAIKVENSSSSGTYINASQAIYDAQGPKMLLADDATSTKVRMVFDKPLDSGSAQNVGNYSLNNGLAVNSASLQPDGHTVILGTSAQTDGSVYTLTINNVSDQLNPHNAVSPNTRASYLYSEIKEYVSDPDTISLWHFNGDGSDASGNGSTLSYGGSVGFAEFSPVGPGRMALHTSSTAINGSFAATANIPDSLVMPLARPLSFEARIYVNAWTSYGIMQANILALTQDYDVNYYLIQQGMWDLPACGKTIINGNQILNSSQFQAAVPTGKWVQLALVFDGTSNNYIYVDGRLVAGPIATAPNFGRTGPWTITLGNFDGYIDEVRLSKVARTFLATPTWLSVSPVSASQINLSWTTNANNATGFEIQRWSATDSAATIIATVTTNVLSFSDSNLAGGTQYNYRVRSYLGTNKSDFSTQVSAKTPPSSILPPTISTQPQGASLAAGANAFLTVGATGTAPLAFQWQLNGVNIDGATASSYSRTNMQTADAGNYSVMVANAGGDITSSNALLTVNNPPVLAPIADQMVNEGTTLIITNVATDPDIPANILTFSLNTNAPPGATIDPISGIFSWTPTEAQGPGTNLITVIVMDNGNPGLSDSKSFTVTVLEVNQPPVLAPIADQMVNEGTTLIITNVATDPDIPANILTFSLSTNAPPGATIDPISGIFSWTPTEAQGPGTNLITVTVVDNGNPGLGDSKSFTVTVLEVNQPPVLAPIADQMVNEGTTLIITNVATDPDIPANILTFSLSTNAPPGATIDPISGIFSWTPTEAQGPGTNLITVIVMDNGNPGLSDSKSFTVTVLEVNQPPVLGFITNRMVHAGTLVTFAVQATDPDLPANLLAYSLESGAPDQAVINATNGIFSWLPTDMQLGTNQIAVRVTDNGTPNLSDTKTFTIVVMPKPSIKAIEISQGSATLTWSAIPGETYRVEYKTNLTDTAWIPLSGDVTSQGDTADKTDSSTSDAERFYHIIVLP